MEKIEVNSKRWFDPTPLEGEEWKFIEGLESMYSISNYGRVMRNARTFSLHDGIERCLKPQIMKLFKNKQGYLLRRVVIRGVKHNLIIARLVALHFLDNPDNLPCVNHKDENKANNHVSNLEFCTYSYNTLYGEGYKNRCKNIRKNKYDTRHIIHQYSLDGKYITSYNGYKEVEKAGYSGVAVLNCCEHRSKQSCGYVWIFDGDVFKAPTYIYDPANSKRVVRYNSNLEEIANYKSINEASKVACISRPFLMKCIELGIHDKDNCFWKYKTE